MELESTPEQIRSREKFRKDLRFRVNRDVVRQSIDYEKFEGMDLDNHSLLCHFKDKEEMDGWIDSLDREERDYLMQKGFRVKFDDGDSGIVHPA